MASKGNDAVSHVDNSDKGETKSDNSNVNNDFNLTTTIANCDEEFEDVFASPELLLEATKFDDANVSHDVELKINPEVLKKPLKTFSCSSCESGVS